MGKFHQLVGLILFLGLTLNCEDRSLSQELKNGNPTASVEVPETYIDRMDGRVEKKANGELYFDAAPFSGYLLSRFENDSVALKQGYLAGRLHGETIAYYENGIIRHIRFYEAGEKNGLHEGYYPNGQKKFNYTFIEGFSEGNHKQWYPDGKVYSDMNYQNGKEFGKQQVWRPDGKLRANYVVRENGRRYGLQGIKRCTKLDGETQEVDPYTGTD